MQAPLVSVVIPTFNNAGMVVQAVESALAQTYDNLEVIVVDDGSEDDTSAMLARYEHRVRYVPKPNGGPASARNVGIDTARGEWVAFLDDDDTWVPHKLSRQLAAARRHELCGAVFSDFEVVSDVGVEQRTVKERMRRVPSGWIFGRLFWHNFICTSTVLTRRDVLVDVGGFNEALRQSEDWHLWLRIAARHQWGFVDEVLASHHARPENLSSSIEGRLTGCGGALERIVLEFPHLAPFARRMRAKQYLSAGLKYFGRGDYARAKARLLDSLRTHKGELRAYPYLVVTFAPRILHPTARWFARHARSLREKALLPLMACDTHLGSSRACKGRRDSGARRPWTG
jgi:glycosyltransferase involved in cell wall biosynthesis